MKFQNIALRENRSCFRALLGMICFVTTQPLVKAASIDWSGSYRLEYVEIERPDFDDDKKMYLSHRLGLYPKIVLSDGMNLFAHFEVLQNSNYPSSNAGQIFGRGSDTGNSHLHQNNQGASFLAVRELYLRWDQEHSQLYAGRTGMDFGAGMSYSSGRNPEHSWSDTFDLVGYKIQMGNFYLMPIVSRPYQASPSLGNSSLDFIWNAFYDNPETRSQVGLLHRSRSSSNMSNDARLNFDESVNTKYTSASVTGPWKTTHTNLFLYRGWEGFNLKTEVGFEAGGIGVTAQGEEIQLGGFGALMELGFPQGDGKWEYEIRLGAASGDDPNTVKYEGFHFNRNYDLGLLLFNHPLGNYDALTSNSKRQRKACAAPPCEIYPIADTLDEESISNAIFISPKANYKMSETWSWENVFVYAQTLTNPSRTKDNATDSYLGFEWNTAVIYRPTSRVKWSNTLAVLHGGGAFKDGQNDRKTGFIYGLQSRLVIDF
jgi:hypothetical protein